MGETTLILDNTTVKAHQHVNGAKKGYNEETGRSLGRLKTKAHMVTDGFGPLQTVSKLQPHITPSHFYYHFLCQSGNYIDNSLQFLYCQWEKFFRYLSFRTASPAFSALRRHGTDITGAFQSGG